MSDEYVFNVEDVQVKRKVIAPYTENGKPKDWQKSADGNFRLTQIRLQLIIERNRLAALVHSKPTSNDRPVS